MKFRSNSVNNKQTHMNPKKIVRTLLILVVLVSNIGCDQISKSIVRQKIGFNEHIGFLNNYVTMTRVENTGAMLSAGSSLSQPLKLVLLILLPIVILAILLIYVLAKKNLSNVLVLAICFIVGGGVGNIYDRFTYGSVTDFLHINFGIFQTGVFNLADVSIMTGVLLACLEVYFKPKTFAGQPPSV
jgi:signal peptidase II